MELEIIMFSEISQTYIWNLHESRWRLLGDRDQGEGQKG
jgi:hypothetical protein